MEASKDHLLPYAQRADFQVGRATELTGRDRRLYRLLEILPGLASWSTLIGVVLLSIYAPFVAAYFIIAFAMYWLLKTAFLSWHLRYNWKRLRHHMSLDWNALIERFSYEHMYHVVILPFYDEPEEVVDATLSSLAAVTYDTQNLIIVLAAEERAGEAAQTLAATMKAKWGSTFGSFLVTTHPGDIAGEMAGKGANAAWAAEQVRTQVLDPHGIRYNHTLVSIFDIDTVVYPEYFSCLMWHFMTAERPLKTSFQPVPVFNNNIWDAPAIARVVAMSSTFWEMVQQERPERMATFSSHAVSFQALYEVGYWQRNMVSEDSRIYWNLLLANDGQYDVVPLSYPVSMDANAAPTLWGTIKNIYRQHRRWTYGVENLCYILYHFSKHERISRRQKIKIAIQQAEGYWSLVTNPIMLFILGWAPIFLGSAEFHQTVLSYNLPIMVRDLLILAMFGLVVSSIISLAMIPPRPEHRSRLRYIVMAVQWILVPATMIIFSAIPGLDAQTRLMFGRYMGFWVTPKSRASS
ncbi:MAG TPA: glycosyltransferase family 2 protein [Candidatus Paceibacterota bacterium]|nr:glycosyltransferase family 2 protein [Candidatus Paceibacterota bacterium]